MGRGIENARFHLTNMFHKFHLHFPCFLVMLTLHVKQCSPAQFAATFGARLRRFGPSCSPTWPVETNPVRMCPGCAMLDPSWAQVGPSRPEFGAISALVGSCVAQLKATPVSFWLSKYTRFFLLCPFPGRGRFSSRSNSNIFAGAVKICLPRTLSVGTWRTWRKYSWQAPNAYWDKLQRGFRTPSEQYQRTYG